MQVGGHGGCWQVAPDVDPTKAITLASIGVSLSRADMHTKEL